MNLFGLWHFGGILLAACLLRCGQDERGVAEKTVREWMGKEIVFWDRDGSLAQTNRFPEDMAHQCFLLNPNLWDLHKAIITGESNKTAIGKSNARAP